MISYGMKRKTSLVFVGVPVGSLTKIIKQTLIKNQIRASIFENSLNRSGIGLGAQTPFPLVGERRSQFSNAQDSWPEWRIGIAGFPMSNNCQKFDEPGDVKVLVSP